MRSREEIISYARESGIDLIGFTDARLTYENLSVFKHWLDSGRAGEMGWLHRNIEKRFDPRLILDGARTVICIAINYFSSLDPPSSHVSRYVRSHDYHAVLKDKLNKLYIFMKEADSGLVARPFVDSAPVAEKALAQKAGLGWQGKNSLLITQEFGSWVFLGELVINREYPVDNPCPDRCGTCRACIDACPSGAIKEDRTVDARLCISYLTIELKRAFTDLEKGMIKKSRMIFGCDVCQEVCPWNRNTPCTKEPGFIKQHDLSNYTIEKLHSLIHEEFYRLRRHSVLDRVSYEQFTRNLAALDWHS